ncbi:MAG TPA: copper oxidase [Thermoanaerobaculia bacterium]|nr:copper oxidase [Thermoanaerobaculia bacterium]
MNNHLRTASRLLIASSIVAVVLPSGPLFAQIIEPPSGCARLIRADVVAFDQVFFWNRLGAVQPQGMIYALRRDVVPIDPLQRLKSGNARLRDDKRPRPLVLRMNVGDCLRIEFENLLATTPRDDQQPATRTASVHVVGMQLVENITDDGSNVGQNPSSLVDPDDSTSYTLYAEREGGYLMYSAGAMTGGEGDGGSLNSGLFGAVIVEPRGSEWYRSQITQLDMKRVTKTTTTSGHPIISYKAKFLAPHPLAGQPILEMLHNNEIIYSDLTALITGPEAGRHREETYKKVAVEPDREQPFREFVTIYHDEIGAVQAFPHFHDKILEPTLHSVRDAFAINYGTGGIGAEILANRFGVGPMADCTECKYEDFFLSAWAVADPAMIVDVPANAPCTKDDIQDAELDCFTIKKKATKAFYPDDPSNVYHSYLRDHLKFRILHAGSKEHHIHHQHTHQWLHTPDEDDSSYLDSQAIGPGSAFTLEMVYNGSGNRNLAVGDSIFHCHFYPHFAQGMWAMWRVHDVLELGTPLDAEGRPQPRSRAYPDGEIMAGTPIPGVVPLPTIAMAPLPEASVQIFDGQVAVRGDGNPGYPFFIPGIAGHRPPHPPLDTIDDGGLPRHVIVGGTFTELHTRTDFSKELVTADARALPETGTFVEIEAMKFHEKRTHDTFTPGGDPAKFVTNGLPRQPGAPYADPCVTDKGHPTGNPRLYQGANIELDVKFNKASWHFFQQRMTALWADVAPTLNGTRAPEPLFFRANSGDCITYQLVNLVPGHYEQDDFQVRTPTDITGQHIHLVKFDVTASDGAANGYNYEDGSFAPDDVLERIDAINRFGGLLLPNGIRQELEPKPHPFFGTKGAQTTVSRWYADEVLNNDGDDRTLRTVFTHDHFGPSTHQQVGLYAGLVIEPRGSVWKDPDTGLPYGGRFDGGPTSWRADIHPPDEKKSYREFMLEFADFQHAYLPEATTFPAPRFVVNPPGRREAGLPFLLAPPVECAGGFRPPCPEAVSADDVGTMVINYRNEPLALRVRDPNDNDQADGLAGDLSYAFRSDVTRADPLFNVQPTFYPKLSKRVQPGDPFTPLLEGYEGDRVQIRILVGAHEEGHNFSVNGVKWLFEPSYNDSGYRNSQMAGISEHYEFIIPALPKTSEGRFGDFLYTAGRATDDLWNGLWGIMRAYKGVRSDLKALPNNPDGKATLKAPNDFTGICPKGAPQKHFKVSAIRADLHLPGGTLVYNSRTNQGGKLHDPTAIIYVRNEDFDETTNKLKPTAPIEPLVLRAAAGDCIQMTLINRLPEDPIDLAGFNTLPMIVRDFNNNQIEPSPHVGLHPQLVYYDVNDSDGMNVGFNPVQTAAPGAQVTYQWYAGGLEPDLTGALVPVPIEFGSVNLMPSDPIKHAHKGAIGSLIIEPIESTWWEDPKMRSSAVITVGHKQIQEYVLQFQTDINMRYGNDGSAVELLAETEDPEDSGQKAFNYRTEPMWKRLNFDPDLPLDQTRNKIFTNAFSNVQIGGDPETPVFYAKTGVPTRFRILNAGGHPRNSVFALHGHVWRELPYVKASHAIGDNEESEFTGTYMGIGPSSHFDVQLEHGAGSLFKIPGDYLFRTQQSFTLDGGLWGILRVEN